MSLSERGNDALVVVDVQRDVVAGAVDRDAVVARIASLVDRARAADVEVVWIQHDDAGLPEESPGWELVDELAPSPSESVVRKQYGDAFEATDLESVLTAGAVGRLFVVGARSDACVRSTLHGAFVRGYDVTLVGDAHTTEDHTAYGAPPPAQVIAHTNLYWSFQRAPGREASVVDADSVRW